MGNNLGRVSLRNYVNFPYHIQLGRYAAIDATEQLDNMHGFHRRTVTVTYTVDGSKSVLELVTSLSNNHLTFRHREVENDLRWQTGHKYFGTIDDKTLEKETETCKPWGDVTKTLVYFHASGSSKGGLLVREQQIKKGDKRPYKVTVTHYYAASSGNVFAQNKIDNGLSMVLNIHLSRKEFDVTVEGPLQHPSSALFYMFEQVCKTGIWMPMACPHCADIQRQPKSEDSDSLPPPRLHGPKQNATSALANNGPVWGDNNGSWNVGKFIDYGGWYLNLSLRE